MRVGFAPRSVEIKPYVPQICAVALQQHCCCWRPTSSHPRTLKLRPPACSSSLARPLHSAAAAAVAAAAVEQCLPARPLFYPLRGWEVWTRKGTAPRLLCCCSCCFFWSAAPLCAPCIYAAAAAPLGWLIRRPHFCPPPFLRDGGCRSRGRYDHALRRCCCCCCQCRSARPGALW
jgi:hypothetical protein